MIRLAVLTLAVLGLTAGVAPAQYVVLSSPPPVVTYSSPVYSSPVYVQPAPVVTTQSAVVYSSPVVTYSSPVVTYSSPIVGYSTPAVSYSYYPTTTVYSVPTGVVVPSTVTTRTYRGFGIFRPWGRYTETYVTPY
jgi:hypothetical protein